MLLRFAGLVCLALILGAFSPSPSNAKPPRCYGAASRDPEQPCSNPALRSRVTPSPDAELLQPDAPCDPWMNSAVVCTCGPPDEAARGTLALIGDSHATMWRAAVAAVADAHDLHAYSVTRPGCAFNFAKPDVNEAQSNDCVAHSRQVVRFVSERPEITTVFVGSNAGLKVARDADGGDGAEQWIQGYVDAWDALPESVTRVLVLRDTFRQVPSTPDCVSRALHRRRNAGIACALSRFWSLPSDAALVAAGRPHRAGLTVDTIDLTPFMCGTWRCFPVVGGVLVLKDIDHITQAFSRTLGPYLLRAFDRLSAG